MKLSIISTAAAEAGKVSLPAQFDEPVRPDLIKRAVLASQANRRQPYGAKPTAGKRAAALISKRRRDYKTCYGHGISRTPRKIMSRRGRRMNWVGAFAPNTVGGRRAHPPKAQKIWEQKINDKERKKAIRSAMSATVISEYFKDKNVPKSYPFVLDSKFESIQKTKEARDVLEKIGFKDELDRTSVVCIRAGRGKMRGRRYRQKKGLLIVISESCKLENAARNIPGIDVVQVKNLNTEMLAPGFTPGRITLFTAKAVELLEKSRMFM